MLSPLGTRNKMAATRSTHEDKDKMVEKPPILDHTDERENKGKKMQPPSLCYFKNSLPQHNNRSVEKQDLGKKKLLCAQKALMLPKCWKKLPSSCRSDSYQHGCSLVQQLETCGVGSSATDTQKKESLVHVHSCF